MGSANESDKKSGGELDGLLVNSTVFYGILGGVGLLVSHFFHKNLMSNFVLPTDSHQLLTLTGFSLLGVGVLLILSYLFESFFVSFRVLKQMFVKIFGQCSIGLAVYLALISSIGEELLFLGVARVCRIGLGLSRLYNHR